MTPKLKSLLLWIPNSKISHEVIAGLRAYTPEIEAGAQKEWQDLLNRNSRVFDGPIWSLVSYQHSAETNTLCLALQKSSYKYQMYTHFTEMGRILPPESRANAFGTSSVCITKDHKVVLGLRGAHLAACPNMWHLMPAGTVDEPDTLNVITKELAEELGLAWDTTVQSVKCVALLDTGVEQGHKPELLWLLQLNVDQATVQSAFEALGKEGDEHSKLVFLSRDEIEPFRQENSLVQVCSDALHLTHQHWVELLGEKV
eukprot:c6563_g1_i2.p1 GENE.c6563_g1_i2~~c6563_g1_i2.p1  ORF type:complete len:257 (+),score=42.32 c6563_g1_i2:36-806(+)